MADQLVTRMIDTMSVGAIAFVVAFGLTPLVSHFLYKWKLAKSIRGGGKTPVFTRLHKNKAGTPTGGGVLIWGTVLILALLFFVLGPVFKIEFFSEHLSFLTREETWLPLAILIGTAALGLVDDVMDAKKGGLSGGGLRVRYRLLIFTVIAAVGAWWFYYKLGFDILHVPGIGDFSIGLWYLPLFIFVVVATAFSVNETDGLDGLAGGVLTMAFIAFGIIAFVQGRVELSMFVSAIVGALLAFLWFNVYPARFFMGDTGSMSLGFTLAIVAFLTNSVLVLPFIGFVLVLESGSVLLQVFSKKVFKRKIFRSTPIHHHFEAAGWPEPKVVMRFWIIAAITALVGLLIGLVGRGAAIFVI
ncbi:MAG: phospho-N-acetylmuramoyl-pentapeptide-transferase [bacterium]|nr:phospho-N-acetylmuramoyl-pentapeptide-transferase [bacterium]